MVESKRIFNIVFEYRTIDEIRNDFLNDKWISKSELYQLKEWETQEFIREYDYLKSQYNDLLNSFNLNALSNYELLERKKQGKL